MYFIKSLQKVFDKKIIERSIELSNLDDIPDMSIQSLIWEGLEQLEYHFFLLIANENRV